MQKTCRQCATSFEITEKDLVFYDKVSPIFANKKYQVPTPTLCPECRMQRRLSWRNERTLYNRKCDLCAAQIISIYSPDKPWKVYCQKCWWSDKWDGTGYAREFDFNKTFFEQFQELQAQVPVISINMHDDNINCDYAHLASGCKNCYLVFASSNNEDCMYTTYIQRCKNVSDCFFIFDSELCYECIDCYNCYQLQHSQYCQNCSNSYLLYDCKGCSDCFGCVSLANKQYYIFNKPYSQEEYKKKLQEIFSNPDWLEESKKQFIQLQKELPHKYYAGISNENVTGNHISFSKNTEESYDCTYLEDCKFCCWLHRAKDCYDHYAWGYPGELGYENQLCGNGFYNVKFSALCATNIKNLTYCHYCFSGSKDLFGCIGLRKKEYCILNKQYTKEEYEELVPKIIEHMTKTGEWGEFFSMSLSPYGYNETVANEYYPLTREAAIKLGAKWKEEDKLYHYEGTKKLPPKDIQSIHDEFTKEILTCTECGKNYKIIPHELRLYKQMNISVPHTCFNCRYKARFNLRNTRHLWDRQCMKCHISIKTTYSPESAETVYCEKCYLEAVY